MVTKTVINHLFNEFKHREITSMTGLERKTRNKLFADFTWIRRYAIDLVERENIDRFVSLSDDQTLYDTVVSLTSDLADLTGAEGEFWGDWQFQYMTDIERIFEKVRKCAENGIKNMGEYREYGCGGI